jgi:hypothetical protein
MAHLDTAMYSHGLPPKKKSPTDPKTSRALEVFLIVSIEV